jgi:exo-beta-1,3-glucanase (GH17 family)
MKQKLWLKVVVLGLFVFAGMVSACTDLVGGGDQPDPAIVAAVANAKAKLDVDMLLVANSSGEADGLIGDLALPETIDGISVTWLSSDQAIIGLDGKVVRPSTVDRPVALTALLRSKGVEDSKELAFKVIADPSPIVLRPLNPAVWNRRAISYSGYREGQQPGGNNPTKEQVLEDLQLLAKEGFGLIRMYGSGQHTADALALIKDHGIDIKLQLGAYISGKYTDEVIYQELDQAIALANTYPDIVASVSVGNEVMVFWSFVKVTPAKMADYCRYVRSRITQPITINDDNTAYDVMPTHANHLAWRQIDYASIHTYGYWDALHNPYSWDPRMLHLAPEQRAEAMMAAVIAYAKKDFNGVRARLNEAGINIPIAVGETGWQTKATAWGSGDTASYARYMGHPVNMAMYFNGMMEWTYGANFDEPGDGFERPIAMFYFASFDEPWKRADDNWGLWDKDRKPKYVLTGQGYTLADAVYFPGEQVPLE